MSRIRHPLAAARIWLADHGRILGLPIAALLIVAIVLVAYPFAPAVEATGTVLAVNMAQARGSGVRAVASVRLADGQRTFVFLHQAGICYAGDPIRLLRHRNLIGAYYRPALQACGRPQ